MTMKQKAAPTLAEIVDYVSEKLGMTVSTATIQKDIYAMRYDASLGFSAPIEYNSSKKGYIYTDPSYSIHKIPVSEEDLQGLEIAIGILEQFKELPAIRLFDDAISRLASTVKLNRENVTGSSILLLDRPKRYHGIEYMADIVEAIQGKNVLRLHYLPFSRKEVKKHTVHPYFIKEYNGRMYLIAKDIHPVKESIFLTFAFDRMTEVVKMPQTFQEENLDKESYFTSAIGISMPDSNPEEIVLQFDSNQTNYLKLQPIHHSQILTENENGCLVTLHLVINYELKALLLSFGNGVIVRKPTRLLNEMKQTIAQMTANYGNA